MSFSFQLSGTLVSCIINDPSVHPTEHINEKSHVIIVCTLYEVFLYFKKLVSFAGRALKIQHFSPVQKDQPAPLLKTYYFFKISPCFSLLPYHINSCIDALLISVKVSQNPLKDFNALF